MSNGNGADGISKEIEKRKQRAIELGIPELIAKLYHDHIKFYPTWIKDPRSRAWIYPSVSDAVKLDENKVKITLQRTVFIFSFTEKWIGGERLGLLEVYENDKKVLALNMLWEFDRHQKEQRTFDIEDFVEGDWIYYFKDLENFLNKRFHS